MAMMVMERACFEMRLLSWLCWGGSVGLGLGQWFVLMRPFTFLSSVEMFGGEVGFVRFVEVCGAVSVDGVVVRCRSECVE